MIPTSSITLCPIPICIEFSVEHNNGISPRFFEINPDSRVKDRRGGKFAPFPVPAHQTGLAELPHPAYRLASP